jgi:transaldolase
MGIGRAIGPRRAAVFLDRDGVLNRALVRDGRPHPPQTVAELELEPDALEALELLKQAGFVLLVASNQPDVARGTVRREVVDAIDAKLAEQLPIDDFLICFHDDGDGCDCRKPGAGLLFRGADRYGLDLKASFVIGDRWRDIAAGRAGGAATVFVDRGYDEPNPDPPADATVGSTLQAARWIVAHSPAPKIPALANLRVKIFADGADKAAIVALAANPLIRGFTTNPTLMNEAGIKDYERFARDLLAAITAYPVSLEVFADDNDEMLRQARKIATWGENVYVKIPVTNTKRETTAPVIRALTAAGTKVNVTAVMTPDQVRGACQALAGGAPACISVFAGRIADTGRDPIPIMAAALDILAPHPGIELIWASPREPLNIFHADSIGTHIITVTADLLAKLPLIGKDLDEYSLETVKMFARDAAKAGFAL